jgi:hypothetical protein
VFVKSHCRPLARSSLVGPPGERSTCGSRGALDADAAGAWLLQRSPNLLWGSADATGKIRFNWRIVQTPTRLIDYVVAHELTAGVVP